MFNQIKLDLYPSKKLIILCIALGTSLQVVIYHIDIELWLKALLSALNLLLCVQQIVQQGTKSAKSSAIQLRLKQTELWLTKRSGASLQVSLEHVFRVGPFLFLWLKSAHPRLSEKLWGTRHLVLISQSSLHAPDKSERYRDTQRQMLRRLMVLIHYNYFATDDTEPMKR